MLHLFGLSFFVKQKTYGIGAISLVALLSFSVPVVGLSPDEKSAVIKACGATKNACVDACSRATGITVPGSFDQQSCKNECYAINRACLRSIAARISPTRPLGGGGGILERDQGFGTQGPGATGVPQVSAADLALYKKNKHDSGVK
jgi:hypothetical protein